MKRVIRNILQLPKGTVIYSITPQPLEIYADDNRLNILILLHTKSPEYQPRSIDIYYEIK